MNSNTNGSELYPRKRILWGVILVAAGCMFLLDRMEIYDVGDIWHYWPIVISLAGVVEILSARCVRDVTRGAMNFIVGVWLYACIEDIWGLDFANSWPIVMIAFGLSIFVNGVAERNKTS